MRYDRNKTIIGKNWNIMETDNLNVPPPLPPDGEQVIKNGDNSNATNLAPRSASHALPVKPQKKLTQTLGFKVAFIVLLSFVLLLPTFMIDSLSVERESTSTQARYEISQKWGRPQHITGPVIAIPYKAKLKGDTAVTEHILYILPKTLNINADVKSQTLYRSIYESVVYNTAINFDGTFKIKGLLPAQVDTTALEMDKAHIVVGITDLRGIAQKLVMDINGNVVEINDGGKDGNIQVEDIYADAEATASATASDTELYEESSVDYADMYQASGASAAKAGVNILPFSSLDSVPFKMHLDLKGSESLNFTPIGETTNIKVKGDCPTPSFGGNFLPDSRNVDANGFTASWKIISINRAYPQAFIDDMSSDLNDSQLEVGLLVPVDSYHKTERAIKYAFMVIVLTFIGVLFVEIKMRKHINVFQYLLVGLALVLFYSLLLSISEHLSFGWAYLIAAAMTIAMITLYLIGVLKHKKMAIAIGGMLTLIYAYIFVLLNLETYALLAGSVGLFIVLALIMYYSLKLRTEDLT